ncbi:MAG: hypothetical protein FWG09_08115 [Synergistaceae bacterium]|nr:hypothetical protein [Synergistaceae bacterium]
MAIHAAEITTAETLQTMLRHISALSNKSLMKLAEYIDELIEEEEEAEDVAYIDSLTPEDYANAVPLEEVTAKYMAVK